MKKRTKFNVEKKTNNRTYNGIIFDSKMEMEYYRDVCIPMLKKKEFKSVDRQVTYVLQEKFKYYGQNIRVIEYVADFVIVDKKDKTIVVDVKGWATTDAKIKAKLFKFKYPKLELRWMTKYNGNWVTYEDNEKRKRENKKLKKLEKLKEKSGG